MSINWKMVVTVIVALAIFYAAKSFLFKSYVAEGGVVESEFAPFA